MRCFVQHRQKDASVLEGRNGAEGAVHPAQSLHPGIKYVLKAESGFLVGR